MKDQDDVRQSRVATLQARLDLTTNEMARFLGVPPTTLCNWKSRGDDGMSAAVVRLLDVLDMIAIMAPNVFHEMVRQCRLDIVVTPPQYPSHAASTG